MALFNNLSKKASAASSKAIQKTKDFSDITRLKAQIDSERNKISDSYFKIGQLYYELHADDYEDSFKPMFEAISGSKQEIAAMEKQIDDLKGIRRCERCGGELEKGALFCSNCGAPVPKIPEKLLEGKIKCSHCGALINSDNMFCIMCGERLEKTPAGLPEPKQDEKHCPSCGTEIEEGSLFCTNCGYKLIEDDSHEEISRGTVALEQNNG